MHTTETIVTTLADKKLASMRVTYQDGTLERVDWTGKDAQSDKFWEYSKYLTQNKRFSRLDLGNGFEWFVDFSLLCLDQPMSKIKQIDENTGSCTFTVSYEGGSTQRIYGTTDRHYGLQWHLVERWLVYHERELSESVTPSGYSYIRTSTMLVGVYKQ